eukprot:jgi/Botrbrau1/14372/Bobra.0014s0027.1
MQPSQCFKSEGLESHRRLLTRQQDSIAGLLVLGSARGGPTRHEVQQVGNCEWGRANGYLLQGNFHSSCSSSHTRGHVNLLRRTL